MVGGGGVKFYPYKKRVGGGLSFSHIEASEEEHKKFQPFTRGAEKVIPCLDGGVGDCRI